MARQIVIIKQLELQEKIIRELIELLEMRARESIWKWDLEGIQGDGSNFKAYKSSGMHILIILKQDGKS